MADNFDGLVYALSNLRHVRDHAPTQTAKIEASERKHLHLLDDIVERPSQI